MAGYSVKVAKAPKGHSIPPLLTSFGAWLKKQRHGSLGWFDALAVEAIPKEWSEANAKRLQESGFAFLSLPDGSLLALLTADEKAPPAVVLLGSEGEARTVTRTLEEFLVKLSKGDTGIDELDDEDDDAGAGRPALRAWLKENGVKAPKAKDFDFNAWLEADGDEDASKGKSTASREGKADAPAPPAQRTRKPTVLASKLGPKTKKLASMMGLRADDPALIAYVTKDLGKKPPLSTSDREEDAYVTPHESKGIELLFTHQIRHEAYPPIPKSGRAFVPYLSYAWLRERVGEEVLAGIAWNADETALVKALGQPTRRKPNRLSKEGATLPEWDLVLDEGAAVVLQIGIGRKGDLAVNVLIDGGLGLSEHGVPNATIVATFVAWAITRGLLDTSRFSAHADLIKAIAARKARGSDLVGAALPRGLWDVHLRDLPNLRMAAYEWFHNVGERGYITKDLCKVFGARTGAHGHDEPKIDDDSWEAVGKATKLFDTVFAAWVGAAKPPLAR